MAKKHHLKMTSNKNPALCLEEGEKYNGLSWPQTNMATGKLRKIIDKEQCSFSIKTLLTWF